MNWLTRYRFARPRTRSVSFARRLSFVPLEDRVTPAPVPTVALATAATPFIGEQNVPVAITFTNPTPAADVPGFGPWVYAVLPRSGDTGNAANDGVSYVAGSATFLGAGITGTVLTSTGTTLTASGAAASYALNAAGAPITITGINSGDQVVFFQLPYISFSTDQPNATVKFLTNVSNKATLGTALAVRAGGGFTLGKDALNNPGTDAPLLAAAVSQNVSPELIRVTKTYVGPEQETATGPNYTRQYVLEARVAPGQTVTNFQLTDALDAGMQFRPDLPVTGTANGGTFQNTTGTTATAAQPGGTVVGNFSQVVGDANAASVDASLTFNFFVPRETSAGADVLPISTGAFRTLTDRAGSAGAWTPIDTLDAPLTTASAYWADPLRNPTDVITAKSVAVQKGVTVLTPGSGLVQQGSGLEYVIDFQISDYFAFDQLDIPDLLPDGVRFDGGVAPTLSLNGGAAGTFAGGNFTVGGVNADGTQSLNFDVSGQAGGAGRYIGAWIPNPAGTGGAVPDPTAFGNAITPPRGPTVGQIRFRATVQNTYTNRVAPNNNVKQGDTLTNTVPTTAPPGILATAGGRVLDFADAATPTGSNRADDTAASVSIRTGQITKTIYAINNSTTVPTTPVLQNGDRVTYRITYVLPTSSAQNFRLNDYLPLPVYNATEVTTANFGAARGTIPAAGTVNYGPGTGAPAGAVQYADGTISGQTNPTFTTNATANTVQFTFPTILQDNAQRTTFVDILFTVTIRDNPYADGFPLTNQANAREGNTADAPTQSDIINQVLLGRPNLVVQKGIVASTRTGLPALGNGGGAFAGVGAGTPFTGTVTSTGLAASPLTPAVSGFDAGDQIQFAVVVENTGSGPRGAFDIVVRDTLPAGLSAPAGGLNLQFRDGTGSNAGFTYFTFGGTNITGNAAAIAAAFFGTGLRISGTGPTTADAVGTNGGAIDSFSATSGRNVLVATYDLRAEDSTQANTVDAGGQLPNTATVDDYAAIAGGTDIAGSNVGSLTDTAQANIAPPTVVKALLSTSVVDATNTNTQAVVGEIGLFRVTVTVPEGETRNFALLDTLPAGLAFRRVVLVNLGSALSSTLTPGTQAAQNSPTPANVVVGTNGSTVTFNFGTVTNSNASSTGTLGNNTIVIEYEVVVLNVGTASPRAGNIAGTTLTNGARGSFITAAGNSTTNLGTASVAVIEPRVNIGKAYTITGTGANTGNGTTNGLAQAGNAVAYTVTMTGVSTTAYDVTLNDPLPTAALDFGATPTIGYSGPAAYTAANFEIVGGVLRTVSPLANLTPGQVITLTLSAATVRGGVLPNQRVDNVAADAWTTLAGTPGVQSQYNANAVERTGVNGDPGQLNDHRASATAGFNIQVPQPTKSLVATSEAGTLGNNVAPGEVATYRLQVLIPRATLPNYQLRDTLAAGLALVPGSVRVIFVSDDGTRITSDTIGGANLGQTAVPGTVLTGANSLLLPAGQITVVGGVVTLSLGQLVNATPEQAGAEFVIVEFQAVTLNVAGNTAGTPGGRTGAATVLPNTFQVFVSGAANGAVSNQINVTVVEPNVGVTKTVRNVTNAGTAAATAGGDAGDVIEYVVTLTNTGNAAAFNATLSDILPAFYGTPSILSIAGAGAGDFVISGSTLQQDGTLFPNGFTLAAGAVVTITVRGTLTAAVTPTQSIPNTASITYTSLPGPNGTGGATPGAAGDTTGERTGGTGTGSNGYTGTSTATVNVPNGTIVKSITATSLAGTTGTNFAVGETVGYQLAVTLPEGTAAPVVLTDVLPAGLAYVAGSFVLDAAAFGGTTGTPTVNYDAASRTLTVTFTTVGTDGDNATGNNTFLVRFTAVVRNVAGNTGVTPPAQTNVPNSATLNAGPAPTVTSNIVPGTVVEPRLQVTKLLLDATATNAGGTKTYRLTVSHAAGSTGPAFDVRLTDALAALGLGINPASVSIFSGPGYATLANNSTVAGGLDATVSELRLGDTVVLQFTVTVNGPGLGGIAGVTPVPAPGATVTNTAGVDYFTAPVGTPERRDEPDLVSNPASFQIKTFSLGGATFRDLNNNGLFEAGLGDTLVAGQNISYRLIGTDAQGNPVDLTLTTNTGIYSFGGLRPGSYRVLQSNQPTGLLDGRDTTAGAGATQASPFGGTGAAPTRTGKTDAVGAVGGAITAITINPADPDGTAGVRYNFGELPPAGVGNVVWRDVNGSGVQNNLNGAGGEPGVQGITVTLTGTDDLGAITLQSAVTAADGTYGFANLRPGAYTVTFGTVAGAETFAFTPPGVGGDAAVDSNANVSTGAAAVSLVAGQTDNSIDAGVVVPVTVGDTVWYDTNADGVQNNGEPGIPGVTVTLTGTDGAGNPVTRTTTTGATGNYSFTALPPGTYVVGVTAPAGAGVNTTPTSQGTGFLASGSNDPNRDFGFHGVGTVGDRVFLDVNNNGAWDAGEGFQGITVTLAGDLNGDGTVGAGETLTTVTGSDGFYSFGNLRTDALDGVPYTVTVSAAQLPPGLTNTTDPDGGADSTSFSANLTAAAPNDPTQDFGYQGPGGVGDTVFLDQNKSGTPDANEGLANVTVRLTATLDARGPRTFTTVTDANGKYAFANLPLRTAAGTPISYTVAVDPATLPPDVVNTVDPDGGLDNTSTLTLTGANGPVDLNQDFGYRGGSGLGDTVFLDYNGNGTPDAGEGIGNVTVTVTADVDGSGPTTFTRVTAANGTYFFDNLPLRRADNSQIVYTVAVNKATLPGGVSNTTDPDGGLDSSSQVNLFTNGPVNLLQDFGYRGPGVIGDAVFLDYNGNGLADAGEGLGNVTVSLTADIDGTGPRTFTRVTGADGLYTFTNLPLAKADGTPIQYTVAVDKTTLPQGVANTADPDGGADGTSVLTLSAGAPVNLLQDFGYQGPGRIGDTVFLDVDGNGLPTPAEGLAKVTVTLTADIDGTGPRTFTTTTGGTGQYLFDRLPTKTAAGAAIAYTVAVAGGLPFNVVNSTDPDGGADGTSTLTLSPVGPVNLAQDFGYRGPGAIGDTVFLDFNGNGLPDANELLANVVVTLTADFDGTGPRTFTRTTGADGKYLFENLPVTRSNETTVVYTVTVSAATVPQGVTNTSDPDGGADGTSELTLTGLQVPVDLNQDFGYQGPGLIGDTVFLDLNANGTPDAGEGLAGVRVTLTADFDGTGPRTLVSITDTSGLYSFPNLPTKTAGGAPVAYAVAVDQTTLPGGVSNTVDPDGGLNSAAALTLSPVGPVNLAQDFGYRGPGKIGDTVFFDFNANGLPDAGEGLDGVTVTLTATYDAAGPRTFQTVTGPGGVYAFANLPLNDQTGTPVVYTVAVATGTLPQAMTNTTDPDGGADSTSQLTLTAAAPVNLVQDFGYRGIGLIGDRVFLDQNGNGVWDAGEGLVNVQVTLTADLRGDGTAESFTVTTGPDGFYTFPNLPTRQAKGETPIPFTVAVVAATLPAGVANSADPDGGLDNTSKLQLSGRVPEDLLQDFGYVGVGKLGDTVYFDANADGGQGTGEPGLAGVAVTLVWFGPDGAAGGGDDLTFATVTDAVGKYGFGNLPDGTFTVTVSPGTLPAGFVPASDLDGIVSPHTAGVSLVAGSRDRQDVDFGYRGTGAVGDRVWIDLNGDGAQDAGEPGLPGVTVTGVWAGPDGKFGTADDATFVQTTGADGKYGFPSLPPGQFKVSVSGLPGGLTNTGDPDGGADSTAVTPLGIGQTILTVDFGYKGDRTLGDLVWLDRDADGKQGTNEPGLPFVTVGLLGAGVDNTFGTADDLVFPAATTDATGAYGFAGLPAGLYRVTVNPLTLPAGVTPTYDLDSATTNADGVTVADLTNVVRNPDADFGYRGPGSLGDRVWFDLNRDGSDAGEPGVPNVGLDVVFAGTDGTFGTADDRTFRMTTDATGFYSLPGLPLGTYRVTVDAATLPADVVLTYDLAGGTKAPTGTVTTTLTAATPTTVLVDFGYAGQRSVGDRVWLDFNADGKQDANEPGVPGAVVTLTWAGVDGVLGTADDAKLTQVAGANGAYLFATVPPGLVRVAVSGGLPAGTVPTFDLDGTADNATQLTLALTDARRDVDFGVRGTSAVSGSVFRDDSNDGRQQPGEPGFLGVPVRLTGTDAVGNVITLDTTTKADGSYAFVGLLPGTYTVVEVSNPPETADGLTTPGLVNGVSVGTAVSNKISQVVVGPGQSSVNNDFAELAGLVSGTVFVDSDRDGKLGGTEQRLGGVTIELVDTTGAVIRTTTTAADGTYLIRGFAPGTYTVRETQPTGYGSTTPNDRVVVVPPLGVTDIDFGERTGTVAGYVYRDMSIDGLRGNAAGETGIGNVPVTLTGTNALGQSVTRTLRTDAAGKYEFVGLLAGTYTVDETRPDGFHYDGLDTAGNFGGPVANDRLGLTLPAGGDAVEYNFGENPPADPFGYVYADLNGNGIKDPGEPGIAGVPITLSGTAFAGTRLERPLSAADVPGGVLTTFTDANGRWEFAIIPPGIYSVTEDRQPLGYLDGKEQDGDPNGPPATVGNERFDAIRLEPMPVRGPFNFGEIVPDPTKQRFLSSSPQAVPGQPMTAMVALSPAFTVTTGTPGTAAPVVTGGGAGSAPMVRVIDYATGGETLRFLAYESTFLGGVRVATGDVTGDGTPDIVTGIGPGGGPRVRVFDGRDAAPVRDFFAYEPTFTGGLFIAAADLTGDGVADIVTGVDTGGGPRVQVFDGTTGALLSNFFAFDPSQRGGVRVAAADTDGDGRIEIIATAGPGVETRIRTFDLAGTRLRELTPFEAAFTGGVSIAAGDIDGDGAADLVAGADAGGGPRVTVFAGRTLAMTASFFAFDPAYTGGVRVATQDVDGDGRAEIVAGAAGGSQRVRVLRATGSVIEDFYAADADVLSGVYVG